MQKTLVVDGFGLIRLSSRFWKWQWTWRFKVLARGYVATFASLLPNYKQLIGLASHSSCPGCFQSPVGSVQLTFLHQELYCLMLRQWCLKETRKAGCWPKIAQLMFLEKSMPFFEALMLVTVITNMFSPTGRWSVIVRFIQLVYFFKDMHSKIYVSWCKLWTSIKHLCKLFSVYNYTMKE